MLKNMKIPGTFFGRCFGSGGVGSSRSPDSGALGSVRSSDPTRNAPSLRHRPSALRCGLQFDGLASASSCDRMDSQHPTSGDQVFLFFSCFQVFLRVFALTDFPHFQHPGCVFLLVGTHADKILSDSRQRTRVEAVLKDVNEKEMTEIEFLKQAIKVIKLVLTN